MGPGAKNLVWGHFGTSNEATGPKIGQNWKIVGFHSWSLLHGCDVKKNWQVHELDVLFVVSTSTIYSLLGKK